MTRIVNPAAVLADTPAAPNLAADRVVRLQMQGSVNLQVEEIRHGGALPRLPDFYVNMYLTQGPRRRLAEPLAEALRAAYAEHRLMVAAE